MSRLKLPKGPIIAYATINPYTGETLQTFPDATGDEVRDPIVNPSERRPIKYAARSMFSMQPSMAASLSTATISSAAGRIACRPEPQTRLTISAGTETCSPQPISACRAGFIRLLA